MARGTKTSSVTTSSGASNFSSHLVQVLNVCLHWQFLHDPCPCNNTIESFVQPIVLPCAPAPSRTPIKHLSTMTHLSALLLTRSVAWQPNGNTSFLCRLCFVRSCVARPSLPTKCRLITVVTNPISKRKHCVAQRSSRQCSSSMPVFELSIAPQKFAQLAQPDRLSAIH